MAKKQFNKQEIFSRAKSHLLQQNAKSIINNACAYRGDNGLKCALGIFIPDEKYSKFLEYRTPRDPALKDAFEFHISRNYEISFLRELQEIHDYCEPEEWEHELGEFAKKHNLTTSE